VSAITLTDLRIWDGESFVDANAIRVQDSKIVAIGDARDLRADSQVVCYPGATAIPGLIDAHVHMVLDPQQKSPPGPDDLPDQIAMRERARQMLAAGITTARDLGGGHWLELKLRDDINAGLIPGPRLLCAGQPITSPKGHCHFWGGEADGIDAIGSVLARQLEHGVDLIKIMATGGRMTGGSQPLLPQFSSKQIAAVVAAAAAAGLDVAAHCHGTAGIQAAASAGVATIEHCSWLGSGGWASDYQAATAQLIANRGIQVSPTVNAGWQRMLGKPVGERVGQSLRAMIALGIPIIASTDAGIPGVHHHQLPQALQVFAQLSGTSAEYTLRSATSQAAAGLKLDNITGRLMTGLSADIVITDGNPLEDLSSLKDPVAVWARGHSG
jgi:imidazolonepropionase-like amidohydrolase